MVPSYSHYSSSNLPAWQKPPLLTESSGQVTIVLDHHLYYGDHSFDNNCHMGRTPHSLHHSNILLWKGCYTHQDSNPHLLIASQTCYHYTKVPRWQQRMEELCLACSLSVSHIPPASHATQETWREPTSRCLQHCYSRMGRGWDLVAAVIRLVWWWWVEVVHQIFWFSSVWSWLLGALSFLG